MHLELDNLLKDFTGEALTLQQGSAPLSLRDVFILAIKTPLRDDESMSLLDRLDIAKFGKQLFSDKETSEYPTEQVSKIKTRANKVFASPAFTLALEDAIENPEPKQAPEETSDVKIQDLIPSPSDGQNNS